MGRSLLGSLMGIWAYTHGRTFTRCLMRTLTKAYVLVNIYLLVSLAIAKLLEIPCIVTANTFSFVCTKCHSVQFRRLFLLYLVESYSTYSRKYIKSYLPQQRYGIFCFLKFPVSCFLFILSTENLLKKRKNSELKE